MSEPIFSVARFAKVARKAVADGIVMLKNDQALPLAAGTKVALFGRSQFNYYKSGTGSGGLVNAAYVVGINNAFDEDKRYEVNQDVANAYAEWLKDHPFVAGKGWADEPWFQEEMPLCPELVAKAAQDSDVAVIIIGRTAGEDQDSTAEAGSYLLTDLEKEMMQKVCAAFKKTVVVLNVGNIIDMNWVNDYAPSAVLYVWQGGQEGGHGVLDVLSGDVNPSGKLADTIAYDINDYPSTKNHGDENRNVYEEDIYVGYRYFETFAKDKVQYPFGFGLSYTTFKMSDPKLVNNEYKTVQVSITVTNTGAVAGREVVQVYVKAPQGKLGKPARVLAGFAKTALLAPGESTEVCIEMPWSVWASYDDAGLTGAKSAFVLESGTYGFYIGSDIRSAQCGGEILLYENMVVEQLEEAMGPVTPFNVMVPHLNPDGSLTEDCRPVSLRTVDPQVRRLERMPAEIPQTGDKGYKLWDVESGKITMDEFIAQLSDEDLVCIVRGEGMSSPKVTPGVAGSFAGVTDHLQSMGIPIGACSDGPSGIRMDCGNIAFAMPNGACLASTFDEPLMEELYAMEGLELRKNRIDTLLGPGINIHRNPLNGRNFEYFSEDPLLTGKMAAAQLRGMHQYNVTGTIKHFACNSQEMRRHFVEAVISERALREIYLRGFEIAVKEGGAYSIMTSYNPINSYWSASNYDMLTTVLRGEWGYTGQVMTDWWARGNDEGEMGSVKNMASMIRAQNDLFMVTSVAEENTNGDNSEEALAAGKVQRSEYQRSAKNICNVIMKTPAFNRMKGVADPLDEELANCVEEDGIAPILEVYPVRMKAGVAELDPAKIIAQKGKTTCALITIDEMGEFELSMTIRASEDSEIVAQIPVSIFKDKELMQIITLIGEEKEWKTVTLKFSHLRKDNFFLKFFFSQSGMEFQKVTLTRLTTHKDNKFWIES